MQGFLLRLSLLLTAFIVIGWYFSQITIYIVISVILAALMRPLTNKIHDIHIIGQNIPRWLSILISYSAIISIIFLLSLIFLPLITQQLVIIGELDLDGIYSQIQGPLNKLENLLFRYQLLENK